MGWIADLLTQIPSAAGYKIQLEAMEKENVALKGENAALKSENQVFQSEIVNLRQEIQRRDDEIQKQESHDVRLDEVKERILLSISNGVRDEAKLPKSTSLSKEAIQFHLEDGRMPEFVSRQNISFLMSINLTPPGRAYLVKHGLLKID